MRLKFVAPLMPTLVNQPPEGDVWSHEVKFDGYRSQMIIDEDGTRIYTRNGHDWTAKYRDLVQEAKRLGAESAIIDGEIILLMPGVFPTLASCARRSPAGSMISILSPSISCISMATICATWRWMSAARFCAA
ncbi:DNA ligase-like protein [Mesorhizobium loti]|nr:DNA ligase-like protein [Mesorhizobium loti]